MKKRTAIIATTAASTVGAIIGGIVTFSDFLNLTPVATALEEINTLSLTIGTEALVVISVTFGLANLVSFLAGMQLGLDKASALVSRLHMFIHHMRDAIGQHSIRIFIPGFSHEVLCNQFERCMITAVENIKNSVSVYLPECSCAISLTDGGERISYHFRDKESRDRTGNFLKSCFTLSTAMEEIENKLLEPPVYVASNIRKTNTDFVDATINDPSSHYLSSLTVAIRVNIDRDLLAGKLTTRRHIEHHTIGYITIETTGRSADNKTVIESAKLAADGLAQTIFVYARKEYEIAPEAECPFSRVLHSFFKNVHEMAAE